MKLLIFTQKVDTKAPVLGFFHRWIQEFASQCESVIVICLQKGHVALPDNVTVYSLGKEEGKGRFTYITRFFRYIWQLRHEYDAVFVHMNQIYVLLGFAVWKVLRKPVGLWYAHGSVSLSLRIAEKFAKYIFTSTKTGFRIYTSKKINIVGQGIDLAQFPHQSAGTNSTNRTLLFIGRISPVKDVMTAIQTVALLNAQADAAYSLKIIGSPVDEAGEAYLAELHAYIADHGLADHVTFVGQVPNTEISSHVASSDAMINPSMTGSLDKVMLESLACRVPVFTCNEAFLGVLGEHKDGFFFTKQQPQEVADLITSFFALSDERKQAVVSYLHAQLSEHHTVDRLIARILSIYSA